MKFRKPRAFATLLITHNLAVAERLAHEIMVMQHGSVREYAFAAQLFRSPKDDYTRNLLAAVLPVRTGLDGGPEE